MKHIELETAIKFWDAIDSVQHKHNESGFNVFAVCKQSVTLHHFTFPGHITVESQHCPIRAMRSLNKELDKVSITYKTRE